MLGMMERWNVGKWAVVGLWLSIVPTFRLSAQVGHDPVLSPYRDIVRGAGPVLFVGRLGGDRGEAGVGPSDALTFGVRYELALGRPLLVQFTAAYAQGDRFIVDPAANDTAPNRRTGPADAGLLMTEIALQLRLTGAKTWHGLAPYVGTGLGMAFDLRSPGDTTGSGYQFGRKLTFGASTGVRWHATRKMTVQLDARAVLWRLRYPVSFKSSAPDGSRVVPITDPLTDWTVHPWVSLGIGWIF